jgi:hypothetical protein
VWQLARARSVEHPPVAREPATSDMKRANYRYNFWMPATMLCIDDDPAKRDYSVYVAPPPIGSATL